MRFSIGYRLLAGGSAYVAYNNNNIILRETGRNRARVMTNGHSHGKRLKTYIIRYFRGVRNGGDNRAGIERRKIVSRGSGPRARDMTDHFRGPTRNLKCKDAQKTSGAATGLRGAVNGRLMSVGGRGCE